MNLLRVSAYILFTVIIFSSCVSTEKIREKEEQKYAAYVPKNYDNHGFILPVASKVPEAHQLHKDAVNNFFNYGDKEELDRILDRMIEIDPTQPTSYLMKNNTVEYESQEWKDWIQKSYELGKNHPSKIERYMILGDYHLLITNKYKKALKYFQKVADIYPDSAEAIWCVGMVYYYSGQTEKALESYKKSVALNPTLGKGYEAVAWAYNDKRNKEIFNPTKALEYLNKAKEYGANPDVNVDFAGTEVMTYYYLEQYKKAISMIEKYRTYGETYKNDVLLNRVYKFANEKLESKIN
jgi:tetratricopeptide (TPR) repeat protein